MEKVCLQASELISCEWCSVRKLPVLFFQTTPEECVRLRTQLNMSQEKGSQWYDCAGDREYKTTQICMENYIYCVLNKIYNTVNICLPETSSSALLSVRVR